LVTPAGRTGIDRSFWFKKTLRPAFELSLAMKVTGIAIRLPSDTNGRAFQRAQYGLPLTAQKRANPKAGEQGPDRTPAGFGTGTEGWK